MGTAKTPTRKRLSNRQSGGGRKSNIARPVPIRSPSSNLLRPGKQQQQQSVGREDVSLGNVQDGVFDAQPGNGNLLKRAFNDRSWLEFADPSDLQYKYPGKLGKFIYGFHLLLPVLFFLIPFIIHKTMPDIALQVGSGKRDEEDRKDVRAYPAI